MTKIRLVLGVVLVLVTGVILAGCGSFGGVESSYTISGKVSDEAGKGMDGVELSLSGGFGVATTAQDGQWSASGLKGTVTVTPAKPGYTFSPVTRQVTQRSANVHFKGTKVGFAIALTVSEGGQVKKTPDKAHYAEGETVTIEAVAGPGYRFVNWGGDYSGTDVRFTVTINSARHFTATFEKIGLTTEIVGVSYDTEEGDGVGNIVAGTDGTIWLQTSKGVYRYSPEGGYLGKAEKNLKLIFAGADGVYGIDAVPQPGAKDAVQLIYQLDTEQGMAEVGEIKFSKPVTTAAGFGFDGKQAFVARLAQESEVTVLVLERSVPGSGTYEELRIPLNEKALEISGVVIEGDSLFTLIQLESAEQCLYQLELNTQSVKQRYALPAELQVTPRGIGKWGDLYIYAEQHIVRLELGSDGTVVADTVNMPDSEIISAVQYKDGFIFSGWVKDLPGVYYLAKVGEPVVPVYQTEMKDEYLFGTHAVGAMGNKAFIPCRNTLKIFEGGSYQSALQLPYHLEDLAVNAGGVILGTSSGTEATVIREGSTEGLEVGVAGARVAVDQDGLFLLRGQVDSQDVIQQVDPEKMEVVELFKLESSGTLSPGIAVLPDGNLVLNWKEELRIYTRTGELVHSSSNVVFDRASDLRYSEYFGQIILLSDGLLYCLDPATLKIAQKVDVKMPGITLNRLAVAEDGTVWLATRQDAVYKVTGIEPAKATTTVGKTTK